VLVEVRSGRGLAENGATLVEDSVAVRGGATVLREDGAKVWQSDGVVSFSRRDLENFQVLVLYIRELNTGVLHYLPARNDPQH
jgi:hypothetical protein